MPIESRGHKDQELAARIKSGALPEDTVADVEYVVGRRPLKVGDETRQPGDPVPEAASWPRLESWLRFGAVIARQAVAPRALTPEEIKEKTSRVRPQRPGPEKIAEEEPRILGSRGLRPLKGVTA